MHAADFEYSGAPGSWQHSSASAALVTMFPGAAQCSVAIHQLLTNCTRALLCHAGRRTSL
jgi:hypothetical protein